MAERAAFYFAQTDYTDISPGFFERAKEKFESWGGLVNYRRLDIASDPVEQGFEPGSYDLVIASEVLHATAYMDRTMRNVRTLVKPGGKVVVIETALLTVFHNIVFGKLPGWWVGEEAERSDGPTLTENQWDVLLRQTGFSGLDGYLPDNLDEPQEPAMGGVLFSTAVPENPQKYAKNSLLLTDQSQSTKIGRLETSLVDLTGTPPDVHHFEHVETSSIDGKTWIVLAFETFSLLHLSETQFTALQKLLLSGQAILWVTRGARNSSPEASMIDGLARVIRSENASVKLVTLDLSDSPALSDVDTASVISSVYRRVFASDTAYNLEDLEFIEDNGIIDVRRVMEHVDKDR